MNIPIRSQMLKVVFENAFDDIKNKYNLTITEIKILLFLAMNKNKNIAKDMVEDIMIAKSHISISVESLVSKGFVIKLPDEKDKKKIHLVICDNKKHIINEILEKQQNLINSVTKGLSPDEIEELKRLSEKVKINIKNIIKEYRKVCLNFLILFFLK